MTSAASNDPAPSKANLSSLAAGLLFGAGLGVSGMTLPSKVVGFLDITGRWDASLAFVMIGAIAVHSALYRLVRRRSSPLFDDKFHIPTRRDLDGKLLGGAALFGVGWGLGGFCPGPALVSAASGKLGASVFVGSMLLGMALQHVLASAPSKPESRRAPGGSEGKAATAKG